MIRILRGLPPHHNKLKSLINTNELNKEMLSNYFISIGELRTRTSLSYNVYRPCATITLSSHIKRSYHYNSFFAQALSSLFSEINIHN